jgi:hypothetical protein
MHFDDLNEIAMMLNTTSILAKTPGLEMFKEAFTQHTSVNVSTGASVTFSDGQDVRPLYLLGVIQDMNPGGHSGLQAATIFWAEVDTVAASIYHNDYVWYGNSMSPNEIRDVTNNVWIAQNIGSGSGTSHNSQLTAYTSSSQAFQIRCNYAWSKLLFLSRTAPSIVRTSGSRITWQATTLNEIGVHSETSHLSCAQLY